VSLPAGWPPLLVVVGGGGVGKTTVAAALALHAAQDGEDTLVMTFDPSQRLRTALGLGARGAPGGGTGPGSESGEGPGAAGRGAHQVEVPSGTPGRLDASLLDPRATFDRLVEAYAPDLATRERILGNRFYDNLAGSLAGILEYMAVERLFEVAQAGRHQRVVLDTPPTRQALDFLEAPRRMVSFLDSGALRIALKPWFDERGRFQPGSRWGPLGRELEGFLDRVVGLDLLRDMAEFFQSFAPLYDGFRERATEVERLLASERTLFVLVSGPGEERIPDTLFFARRLEAAGYRLGPVVVNRVHPAPQRPAASPADPRDGRALVAWLGERDRHGLAALRGLLPPPRQVIDVPLLHRQPTGVAGLAELAELLAQRLAAGVPG
jgi:anion-transporting  ArsA/GET3 family ATPase